MNKPTKLSRVFQDKHDLMKYGMGIAKIKRSRAMFVALSVISVLVNSSTLRLATPYRIAVWFVKSQNADTGNAGNQEIKEKEIPHSEVM